MLYAGGTNAICRIEVQGVPHGDRLRLNPPILSRPPRAPEHAARRAFRQAGTAEATRNYRIRSLRAARRPWPHSDRCARLRETHIYSSHP